MRIVTAFFLAAAVTGGTAFAQEGAAPLEDGGYIRIGGGATFVNGWEQSFARNPDTVVCLAIGCNPDSQTLDFKSGWAGTAAIGFDYADGIRTELEYRYTQSEVSTQRLFEGGFEVSNAAPDENVSGHFLMSNFYFDFYTKSAVTPYIGGGVGGAFIENERGMRDAALAYQGRAGLSVSMGDGWSTDVEYLFVRTKRLVFGPNTEDFTPAGPFELNISGDRYQSSSVMLFLRKRL